MKNKYIKYFSKERGKEIIASIKKRQYILFILLLILAFTGIYWYDVSSHSANKNFTNIIFIFLIAIDFILFTIFIFFSKLLTSVLDYVFYEQVDFEKYLEMLSNLHEVERNRRVKREYFQVSLFGEAQVAYFTGNFEKSLHFLEMIDISKLTSKHRVFYQNSILYNKCLNYAMLGNFKSAEELLQSLDTKYKKSAQAIIEVLKGNECYYFSDSLSHKRLEVISRSYYQALNLLNANDKSAAKEKFQQIADENPELFYVRESKKYLEELENE